VGSMIVGSAPFIEKARIYRKMFGGGMRQAGVIAAAGLVALEKSPGRLREDHENAQFLARGIAPLPGLKIDAAKVRSNIVIFDCEGTGKNAVEFCDVLREKDIWALDTATYSVRFVTHCDVGRAGCERALAVVKEIVARPQTARA
jgi:threonine aldolase